MSGFLKEIIKETQFELIIDTKIFPKDIILRAAYAFLDKGYFFFRFDTEQNIVLEFNAKDGVKIAPKSIIGEFSDELLAVYLRDKLEKDNKVIREIIVQKALIGPIDSENFVTFDTDRQEKDVIDFDKDIDEILREIENDPDLKIDEQEIENILKEIEEETESEIQKPSLKADVKSISDAKNMFKKKDK